MATIVPSFDNSFQFNYMNTISGRVACLRPRLPRRFRDFRRQPATVGRDNAWICPDFGTMALSPITDSVPAQARQ